MHQTIREENSSNIHRYIFPSLCVKLSNNISPFWKINKRSFVGLLVQVNKYKKLIRCYGYFSLFTATNKHISIILFSKSKFINFIRSRKYKYKLVIFLHFYKNIIKNIVRIKWNAAHFLITFSPQYK